MNQLNVATMPRSSAASFTELASEFDDGAWREQAACQKQDTGLFFLEGKGGNRSYFEARCLCFSCPVQKECLDFAVNNCIFWGVWGGMTYKDRRAYASGKRSHEITILEIVRVGRTDHTVESIASALNISVEEVKQAINKPIKKENKK